MKQSDTSITVALRVRPLSENERTRSIASIIKQAPSNPKVVIIGERGFSFDHVFIKEGQETVFNLLMTPVLEKLLEGVNCSVIAYGQTGTGKTYTMGTEPQDFGDPLNCGLISRTAERLFESCCISDNTLSIAVSFVEIYNEEVFELLTDKPVRLDVKGFQIRGLTSVPVNTMDAVGSLLCQGTKNRHTRPTLLNSSSSRSHAIFTFRLCRHIGNDVLLSELHMVDLAGSERAKRTRTHGDAFQEAVCINRGLLELGNVIQSLSSGRHGNHVPYRNSLLTSVLHGSLQVQNMIAMVACVSPSELDMPETVNTLRFVEKSKKVMQAIEINKIVRLHKNKAIPTSSTIHPRYPLAVHNYQYSSVARNARNRQCGTSTSSSLCDSVYSLNIEENVSSNMNEAGGFISPIVKKCCDQIESNLNGRIEQIVLTTIQKQKKTRRCSVNDVSAVICSPLLNDSRELLPLSNNRKTVFRHEIEKFQEQMREIMKSEMRNIIQEEIKVALTNTICSTVEALHKKKISPGRGAPLLCRRLDFEQNTSVTEEDIKLQPRRSIRLFRKEKQNSSSCNENNMVIVNDIPMNVDFRENGGQMLASTPLSIPFVYLTNKKTQSELGTPRKISCLSPKRYDCISEGFSFSGRCDSPAHCTREKISCVEAQETRLRHSIRLSAKCLNHVQESTTAKYSLTNTVPAPLTGNPSRQMKNLHVQNTQILSRNDPGQIYEGSYDPVSHCSNVTETITAVHSPLPAQKSLWRFDSMLQTENHCTMPVHSDSPPHRYGNHHNTPIRERFDEGTYVFTARNSHSKSSSQDQHQSRIGSLAGHSKIINQSLKIVSNTNKDCRRKIKHHKTVLRRGSTKTPKKIVTMKKLSLDVSNNVHLEHSSRIMSVLNTGCPRDLQKLPTIGPKTALIINNYRKLSGQTFATVKDLRKIPGLNKNFHEKFALANLVV